MNSQNKIYFVNISEQKECKCLCHKLGYPHAIEPCCEKAKENKKVNQENSK